MLRLPVDRRGLTVGVVVALLVTVAALSFARPFWRAEAAAVGALLDASGTVHRVDQAAEVPGHFSRLRAGGPMVSVDVRRSEIPPGVAASIAVALVATSIGMLRWKRVPLPLRVLWLAAAILGIVSVLYTAWSSAGPPHPVGSTIVGFQDSGLLIMIVASLLFAFEVFPIPGPVAVKAGWLGALIAFSAIWSVVRIAVALAAAARFGTWPFLFLHYIGGIYIDFLYVVAFYSFATNGLAARQARHARLRQAASRSAA